MKISKHLLNRLLRKEILKEATILTADEAITNAIHDWVSASYIFNKG